MKKNDNESQIFAGDVDVFRPFFFNLKNRNPVLLYTGPEKRFTTTTQRGPKNPRINLGFCDSRP